MYWNKAIFFGEIMVWQTCNNGCQPQSWTSSSIGIFHCNMVDNHSIVVKFVKPTTAAWWNVFIKIVQIWFNAKIFCFRWMFVKIVYFLINTTNDRFIRIRLLLGMKYNIMYFFRFESYLVLYRRWLHVFTRWEEIEKQKN